MPATKNSVWIWFKPDSPHPKSIAENLAQALINQGWEARIGLEPTGQERLAISVGGDGTFLSMVRRLGEKRFSIPVLGIHGSRGIGFLTTCKIPGEPEMKAWSEMMAGKIIAKDGATHPYFGLTASVSNKNSNQEKTTLWALNDIVIGRTALSRMLSLKLDCNDSVLYQKLKGDGVIFSSALGSTAYALSAGGPVIDPQLNVIEVTPICPHPSPQRSMVFGGQTKLTAESLDGSMHAMITLDGQEGVEFRIDDVLSVGVAPKPVEIFAPEMEDRYSCGTYFQALCRLGIGGAHVSGS